MKKHERKLGSLESTTLEVAFATKQRGDQQANKLRDQIAQLADQVAKIEAAKEKEVGRLVGYLNAGPHHSPEIPTDLEGVEVSGSAGKLVATWPAPAPEADPVAEDAAPDRATAEEEPLAAATA